jgi:2-polyprenyl-3-methyl-5-hydroxy-6-metoxy-1,4-benzoquinol methylase
MRQITEKEKYPTLSRWIKNKLINKMFKDNSYLAQKYFLEIGCGTGEILEFLDNYKMSGEGTDLSQDAIDIAKTRMPKDSKIKIYKKNFFELNQKYGLTLMMDVLEHLEDDDSAVEKMNLLLNKDGFFILNVPAHQKLFSEFDEAVGHFRRYEKDDLIKLLKKHGFEIKIFWSYGTNLLSLTGSIFSKKEKNMEISRKERTVHSGMTQPSFMKKYYSLFSKFYFLSYLQWPFLNTDIGANYLILCKKSGEKA